MADLASQAKNTSDRMRAKARALVEPGFMKMGAEVAAKKRTEPGDAQQANAAQKNKAGDQGASPTPYAKGGSVRAFAKGGKVHGDEAQDKKLFTKMFKSEEAKEGPEKLAKGGAAKARKSAPKKAPPKMMPPVMPPDMGAAPPPMAGPPVGAPPPMAGAGGPPPQGFKKGGSFKPGGEKGKLHREMGIPEGQKIPKAKLSAAANSSDPEKRRDAIRAQTMAKWKHADGGSIKCADGGMADRKAQKFAVGGVAKIRHDEATPAGKQKPSKGSGWDAYK